MIPSIDFQLVILGNRHGQGVNYGEYYTQMMNDEISELFISISGTKVHP